MVTKDIYFKQMPSDLLKHKKRLQTLDYLLDKVHKKEDLKMVRQLLNDSKEKGYNVEIYEQIYNFLYDSFSVIDKPIINKHYLTKNE